MFEEFNWAWVCQLNNLGSFFFLVDTSLIVWQEEHVIETDR